MEKNCKECGIGHNGYCQTKTCTNCGYFERMAKQFKSDAETWRKEYVELQLKSSSEIEHAKNELLDMKRRVRRLFEQSTDILEDLDD